MSSKGFLKSLRVFGPLEGLKTKNIGPIHKKKKNPELLGCFLTYTKFLKKLVQNWLFCRAISLKRARNSQNNIGQRFEPLTKWVENHIFRSLDIGILSSKVEKILISKNEFLTFFSHIHS